jgi:hypothetical protein
VDIYSNLFFLTIDFWSMCEDSDCDVCRWPDLIMFIETTNLWQILTP